MRLWGGLSEMRLGSPEPSACGTVNRKVGQSQMKALRVFLRNVVPPIQGTG